jgi:TfoX/Sxy family transcriptional regulator of competence genes
LAEPYLNHLSHIIEQLGPISAENVTLEARHFFSGAALFANGKICASLSPAGFAVKLPARIRQSLLDERKGKEFRFFANGPIKREYILLSDSFIQDEKALRELINMSVNYVVILPGSNTEAVKE